MNLEQLENLSQTIAENIPGGFASPVKTFQDGEYKFEIAVSAFINDHFPVIIAKLSDTNIKITSSVLTDDGESRSLYFNSPLPNTNTEDYILNLYIQVSNFYKNI